MVPTPSNRRLSVTGWPMCSMSTSRAGRRGSTGGRVRDRNLKSPRSDAMTGRRLSTR